MSDPHALSLSLAFVPDDVLDFVRAISEADIWLAREVCDFMEKPWKWQTEYEHWLSLGSPTDTSSAEFDQFAAYMADPDRGRIEL